MATDEDYLRCIESLSAADWKVDAVLTHAAPLEAMDYVGDCRVAYWRTESAYRGLKEPLVPFFQFLAEKTVFKCWYFGHTHVSEAFVLSTTDGERAYRALYKGLVKAD